MDPRHAQLVSGGAFNIGDQPGPSNRNLEIGQAGPSSINVAHETDFVEDPILDDDEPYPLEWE